MTVANRALYTFSRWLNRDVELSSLSLTSTGSSRMNPMLFGKYCLLERISVGGMAEVFRAKPFNAPGFDGYLALKRILPHLAEDDEFIMMFVDEAKLTVQLDHPNIVRIYELGQFQSSYYILMEFIGGKDLLNLQKTVRRRRETIGVELSCLIARDIARGLDYAHRKLDANGRPLNIIHRDVSPQNVLIDYAGNVKVIDFGIAKAAVQSTRTQVGVLKGKMGYMSPEQVRGQTLDSRSDIFAIGTVLWEMLTNRRLFNGDTEYETMQRVKDAEADPPSAKNDSIPIEVDRIAMKALMADREQRYQTGAELADDLDKWLRTRGTTSRDLSEWMREVYADDLEEEIEKREQFNQIQSPEDVRLWQTNKRDETASDSNKKGPPALPKEDKTEIWDAEILPDEESVDPLAFASQHTVVQAGGFDPSRYAASSSPDTSPSLGESHGEVAKTRFPVGQGDRSREPVDSRGQIGQKTQSEFLDEQTRPDAPIPDVPYPRLRQVSLALGVVVFGLVVAVALVTAFAPSNGATGSLVITSSPSRGAVVLVDGRPLAESTPIRVEQLETSTHVVEIRHPDFKPYMESVQIQGSSIESLNVDLEPKPPPTGVLVLSIPDPADADAWLNGDSLPDIDAEMRFELEAGPNLVEVLASDVRPFRKIVEVEAEGEHTLVVESQPIGGSVRVQGPDGSRVRLDRKRIGNVPLTLEEILPGTMYGLEVRGRRERLSTVLGVPESLRSTYRVDFDDSSRSLTEDDFGYLTVSTGDDWWSVWIDGEDTGLVTPIRYKDRLPVAAGSRVLSLRRGFDSHEIPLEIAAGGNLAVRQDLPFRWRSSPN